MNRPLTALLLSAIFWGTVGCAQPQDRWPPTDADIECYSLDGKPLRRMPPGSKTTELERDLAKAQDDRSDWPDDPDRLIWVGRRQAYLWRMRDAIETFSRGIDRFPNDPRFYRHRGHRYINVRQFALAVADLNRAAELMSGRPDQPEPDGQPNAKNIPLTTLNYNVWYHLGVAHYLQGDFRAADAVFQRCEAFRRGFDDNIVGISYWRYLCLRRLDRPAAARAVLAPVRRDMNIIESFAYHHLAWSFANPDGTPGLPPPGENTGVYQVTMAYGEGMKALLDGDRTTARRKFEQAVSQGTWPAFACIAAERELLRLRAN